MNTEHLLDLPILLPKDLKIVKELVYDPGNIELVNLQLSAESKEYSACSFALNGKKVQHRISKITPKKVGQFVTIWKRNKEGITAPFDISDPVDFIIITVRCEDYLGQFVFPKSILAAQGIISRNGQGGKRGIRIYPPWDMVTNKQAQQTQKWQEPYFFVINPDAGVGHDQQENLFERFGQLLSF